MTNDAPVRHSYLSWMYEALGMQYSVLLPLAGLICFVLALILVVRGKGPMAAAALILIVHVPFLIGIFAAVQGIIASYSIIAMSIVAPRPSDLAQEYSTALFATLVGIAMMVPGYSVAAVGALVRALVATDHEPKR